MTFFIFYLQCVIIIRHCRASIYFYFSASMLPPLCPPSGQSVGFTNERRVCLAVVTSVKGQLHKAVNVTYQNESDGSTDA